MGAQIILCDGFEVVSPPELNELFLFENDLSGSNGDASTVTTEDDDAVFSGDSPPSDAAEEWPSPKSVRSFYFVKQHPCDDPEIRVKINEADKEIFQCNVARIQIFDSLKAKRAERSALFAQMECLKSERDGYNAIFDDKKRELEPLQDALGKLRCASGAQLCSSEKELDDLIYSMHYRIENETITLTEEKQLLKEIKQLEGTQEKIVANSEIKGQIQDSLGQKEAIIGHVKSMAMNLNDVKKDRQAATAKINRLSEKLRRIKMEIESMDVELACVLDKRDKAFDRIKMLRRHRDQRNAAFFHSRSVMIRARELVATGNVKDLEELANAEGEKFMSLWNADKAFRHDYEERVSRSLEERQLSRDGRMKNLEEDLLVALETLGPLNIRTEGVRGARDRRGRQRQDSSSCSSQDGNVVTKKADKVAGETVIDSNKSSAEESDGGDLYIPRYEKPQEEEEIDEETLKEKKRVEQLEKAQQAMERKRKLQEKAAAKAAIRAQKEAEKKLKEREKKAKKKAAASSSPSDRNDTSEAVTEASEPEKAESSVLPKEKRSSVLPKQRSFRYRHRGRGAEALPKAIIKRRKAYKFWCWAASSTAFALALLVFAFFYVQ